MKRARIIDIISALLVLLFAYAAVSKLADYETFKFQLGRSPYVTKMAGFIAWALPLAELIIVALLLIKRTQLIGLYASFFLMALFTGYIYAMLHFSYYVPCSCGGVLSMMSWNQHLLFNIVFTALAFTGILIHKNNKENNRQKWPWGVPHKTHPVRGL